MAAIQIFATGGTFDKEYNELNGELFFRDTHILQLLHQGRSRVDVKIRTLMLKDSLFMTDADRQVVLDACQKCDCERIVITHGTDTMVETARVLGQANMNKTIVLTGAMVPIVFGSSDGLFNFGCALAFAEALPKGVYVAMNGKYFHWHSVRKVKEAGYFE